MTITDPGNTTKTTTYLNTGTIGTGAPSSTKVTDSGNNVLRSTRYDWSYENSSTGANPRVYAVRQFLGDTGQGALTYYTYGSYGNVTWVDEYDYDGTLKRTTSTTYVTDAVFTGACHILDLPSEVFVRGGTLGSTASRTRYSYNETTAADPDSGSTVTTFDPNIRCAANATSIKQYTVPATPSGEIIRTRTFDKFGNVVTDALNQLEWEYESQSMFAYMKRITRGGVLTKRFSYDIGTGNLATSTDEQNQTTSFAYDTANRLHQVTYPNQVTETVGYGFSPGEPLRRVTRSTTANNLIQITDYDANGHPVYEEVRNGTSAVSKIDRNYDTVGRLSSVSNPYSTEAVLWTNYVYDLLGRALTITPPGNSGSYAYAYSGNATVSTDPAGKQRRTYTDALGRVVEVHEPGWGDSTPGRGSVTISGSQSQRCVFDPDEGRVCYVNVAAVSITANGFTKTADANSSSTPASLASALASAFNSDPASPVFASASSATVNLTSKVNSFNSNYSLSASVGFDSEHFFSATINVATSGPNLTGGRDAAAQGTPSLDHPIITKYSYNALNQLTWVSLADNGAANGQPQPGQTRSYVYDGLGRLTSETNPENGTTTYTYSGLPLQQRTDARGITTIYGYDSLQRLKTLTYSDSTPAVTYTYGTDANSFESGRVISRSEAANSERYHYDQMGRIWKVGQEISGTTYNTEYVYNNTGGLSSIQYPSGRLVSNVYDEIGRLKEIESAGVKYFSVLDPNQDYSPAGQLLRFDYPNGVKAEFGYNERLQLASIRHWTPSGEILNLAYNYGPANNGQIRQIDYFSTPGVRDNARSVTYEYDAWSRLSTAGTLDLNAAATWRLSWNYDRFGNRLNQNLIGGNIEAYQPALSADPLKNWINTTGFAHNFAGGMSADGGHTYSFDAENRLVGADGSSTYRYSGPVRVEKSTGGSTTRYVYSGNKVLAKYVNGGLAEEYIYLGEQMLARVPANGNPILRHMDHLSLRAETDATGQKVREYGHLPFGDTWYEGGSGSSSEWVFTSYQRDTETGLDYSIFRHYNSRYGRWMSPDPAGMGAASESDPQSWNRYTYVLNDPTNLVDPLGLQCRPGAPGYEDDCPPPPPPTPEEYDPGYGANPWARREGGIYKPRIRLDDCNFGKGSKGGCNGTPEKPADKQQPKQPTEVEQCIVQAVDAFNTRRTEALARANDTFQSNYKPTVDSVAIGTIAYAFPKLLVGAPMSGPVLGTGLALGTAARSIWYGLKAEVGFVYDDLKSAGALQYQIDLCRRGQ